MKKLGQLFGAELWLDTTTDDLAQKAEHYLEMLAKEHYAKKTDDELAKEVADALPKKPLYVGDIGMEIKF